MSFLGMPAHDPPPYSTAADRPRHPLAGEIQRPWTVIVIVLVITIRWSAEQVTALLGALVPVIAVLRGGAGDQSQQA